MKSTGEISPLTAIVHFDGTLGRFPCAGFKTGTALPIGRDAIRTLGAAGDRRYPDFD
jgi:hypothetical protein